MCIRDSGRIRLIFCIIVQAKRVKRSIVEVCRLEHLSGQLEKEMMETPSCGKCPFPMARSASSRWSSQVGWQISRIQPHKSAWFYLLVTITTGTMMVAAITLVLSVKLIRNWQEITAFRDHNDFYKKIDQNTFLD